jgi:hypothetical protein
MKQLIFLILLIVFVTGCMKPSEDYVFPWLAKLVNWLLIIAVFLVVTMAGEAAEKEKRKRQPNHNVSTQQRNHIPTSVKREVWRRDQGRCVECGSKEKLEFDHIIPVSKGGSNTARNVQLLCEKCNRSKGNKIE